MISEPGVLPRYGDLGSQGRYCSSARPHQDGMGSVAVRFPKGRVYSETGGPGEGVVGRHGATVVTILSLPRACHGVRRISRPWLLRGGVHLDGQVLRKMRQ
jgi:hypothetical protein